MEMVNLQIDGKQVSVAKGTNLIEAAKIAGVTVPHYCYHPHLSVPGNCRMCQVEVVGAPKLMIGCHAQVQEGMQVKTQASSQQVKDAQAATLEFILINHPLDCTVCDQSGHCKLQDYHFEYNAKPSRFLEVKEHKVKAEPLGPNVILDGERCIMCTRCIRFCDEVTKTSELGMLNRGDHSVIAINPGKELNNALSGTVVDLCPVGALTHRKWRFNTRIWYTSQVNSICPGCSTGCNVKVAARDGKVVQVKARLNADVNKEWLCDEGRYGFNRFLAEEKVVSAKVAGKESTTEQALGFFTSLKNKALNVFLAADLLLEDYAIIKKYLDAFHPGSKVVIAYKTRSLNDVEKILVSPDYAANYKAAVYLGLVKENLEQDFVSLANDLRDGKLENALFVGDRCLQGVEDGALIAAINKLNNTCAIVADAQNALSSAANTIIPGRSILEKSGLMINSKNYLQHSERVVEFASGTDPEWRIFNKASKLNGKQLIEAISDRDVTLAMIKELPALAGTTIKALKNKSLFLG